MTAPAPAQPLIKSGARYTVEVGRCVLFGLVASTLCAAAYFWACATVGPTVHRSLVVVLSALVFPALYAVAGHQRGIGRALASLARSHGGFLFDHTVGRFLEALESRRPGASASVIASPRRLVQAFRVYLHEAGTMPRPIRRVALRYVQRFVQQLDAEQLRRENVVVDGRVNAAALKHWAVARMHGQFRPTWRAFGAVLASQAMVTGALAWASH